jgi:hypothetical protein
MPSGSHLSRFLCSSRTLRKPLLHCGQIEADIFPQLEMGNGVRGGLPGPVVDKRGGYSEQVSEFLGFQELVQRRVLLGKLRGLKGQQRKRNRAQSVLRASERLGK